MRTQTLYTSGIQQLGWCTITCPFTSEEGVGDAVDSYAYDGKRTRKWNVKCLPYGQNWAAGMHKGFVHVLPQITCCTHNMHIRIACSRPHTVPRHACMHALVLA